MTGEKMQKLNATILRKTSPKGEIRTQALSHEEQEVKLITPSIQMITTCLASLPKVASKSNTV